LAFTPRRNTSSALTHSSQDAITVNDLKDGDGTHSANRISGVWARLVRVLKSEIGADSPSFAAVESSSIGLPKKRPFNACPADRGESCW
jgi:hypothetical protein